MKINRILALMFAAVCAIGAFADGPFREHRYNSFQATPTEPGQIVFVGNSITNMHSWFEAFGSHQEVIGRGNSGGYTTEVLENLESYIDSKPSKLFLMIGTNDMSAGYANGELNARRVMAIVKRIRVESPETEIFVQTVLPRSSNRKPDYEYNNTLLKQWIPALNDDKVHIINLSEVCAGIDGNGKWSYDGLHPRPIGYAAWCHAIENSVGYNTVYPATIDLQDPAGAGANSNGARIEQFPYFPVSEGDVLFFGDEQVHGGEWHELLRSNKIKDRAQLWGWGGISLTVARNVVRNSLKDQPVKPSKIFLFYGVADQNETNYRAVVDEAKAQAPDAKIYIVALSPSTHAQTDAVRVDFNTKLRTIADEKGATYIDMYTALKENMSGNIMHTNYISGRGYVVMANKLAEYLTEEGVNPVSLDEYEQVYTTRANRRIVGNALTEAFMLEYGDQPGEIKEIHRAEIEAAINKAGTALANGEVTSAAKANEIASELNETISAAVADINMPTISTDGLEVWYTLTSNRNNLSLIARDGALFGDNAAGSITEGDNIWKFTARADGSLNIVNANGLFVNPNVPHDTQLTVSTTEPSAGWTLDNSNVANGTFVIYSGTTSQFNQTNKENKVYNWHNGCPNLTDQGCAYVISLFEGRIVDASRMPNHSGWYYITREDNNKQVVNLDTPVLQAGDKHYSYSLQYADITQSPKGWIYINVENGNRNVKGLNGFYTGEYVANSRTPYNVRMTGTNTDAFNVQFWTAFSISGVDNVIGRSSGSNAPHLFQRVSDEALAQYDVWTVNIVANQALHPMIDTRVTYNNEANRGIATVYNGGSFVVKAGTAITADDITVTAADGVEQDFEAPVVRIDTANKSINVLYREADVPATSPLAEGWYTLDLSGVVTSRTDLTNWVNTAISEGTTRWHACEEEYEQNLNGNFNYYHVGISNPASIDPALCFFHIGNSTMTQVQITSQNGHHLQGNGTAGRTAYNMPVSALTLFGNMTIPACLWKNNNINAPHDLLGSFSGNSCIYQTEPADLSAYDLYSVTIIGETPATHVVDDVKIGLNIPENKGLQAVYNGGTFFVDKDTHIEAAYVVTPVHADNPTPLVTIANGVITVDYTQDGTQSGIGEINADTTDGAIYDLQGRRVAAPAKGIYIVNGKKTVF